MTAIGFQRHDHHACITTTVKSVETQCQNRGLLLTPVRRRVLEILLEKHCALGAYDILDRLREEGLGSQPPVVYRALEFLVSNGFAHKIERLNAFISCTHPDKPHVPAFLICRNCDAVAESHTEQSHGLLGGAAQDAGFVIERAVLEAEGLCPNCQSA